ncbi:aminotransferase class I/II-fold pyridoxal phosphate-dependent enzyme [Prevotella sp. HUN102]|uniref:aminotransferase class I/II-fold pyridoxal phosphate-dependent enzyme n=1 Tax=Prevotella sp. HUN102 TaxID=1392486 RepID=UPI00048E2E3A|nr:aminotransferase class I/II-fold pyridoxal phosphate-dependent enzyme [Prevotella sp. HUN102]
MQAIILAAGMGKRLGELTKGNTKCMLEVNGTRLIDRVINQLSKLQLERLILVVGYERENLMKYIGNRYDSQIKIEFIENPIYDKTNNIYSLALAKEELCKDDTLLLESDLIFDDELLRMLIENENPNLALVDKYQTWMDGTMVRINEEKEIVNFIPKSAFRYEEVEEYYKTVNIYKFSKEFLTNVYVPFLDAYSKVMGNNGYYEQVLRVITHLHRANLKALPLNGQKWYEIDDVQDLDIASTIFSDGETKYHEYHKRYGGFWRFPQLLDYCYLVNPYFPTKRMKDEMRANFDTLLSEYPSGMYVNSLLAAKYFGIRQEYTVVGNGAAELIKIVMEEHTDKKVGVMFPTFDEYPNRLKPEQIVPFISTKEDFGYTADDLMSFFADKDISILLLINPDNPSGNFIPKKDVLRLAEWAEHKGIKLLVDESFVDFTDDFEDNSLLHNEILERFPGLMVMKSISKSYGVPGLRLGVFVSSDEELIAKLKKEVSIWNINSFGEFYLQIFGKYENDYKYACEKFIKERNIFFEELKQIPFLKVIPSQANYFLCEVTKKYTSAELTQKLIENDVIISNCSLKRNMGNNKQLVRFAIRDRKDDSKLVEILHRL